MMLAAFLFFDDGSAVLIEGKRFYIHKVYAGNSIGSCDTLKSLQPDARICLLLLPAQFLHHQQSWFLLPPDRPDGFSAAQTFCGSRTVESYVSTSENNDTLAHSGLLTKTCITQEINIYRTPGSSLPSIGRRTPLCAPMVIKTASYSLSNSTGLSTFVFVSMTTPCSSITFASCAMISRGSR